MKFALAQLGKLKMPYSFDESLDLSKELDGFEDILTSSLCEVHTTIRERGIETYCCDFNIKIELMLQDSVTLESVPYLIETTASEIFTTDDTMDDVFMIEGITLDTKEAILTNILINKPMSFTNSEYIPDEEYEEDEEEVDDINPMFAALKDLL